MNARVLDGEIITTRFEDTRAYRGVRTRRIFAFLLDYFFVALLTIPFAILVAILGLLTFGLGWALFSVLVPMVAILYIWNTLGSRDQATTGMKIMGIRLEKLDGSLRCVCSNSTGERLKMELEKTRLYDFFAPHIFSAGEVGTREPKPSPNVYLHALKQFGVPPREAVVIEDSVFGVIAAKLSGSRVVGFTGGKHTWPGHADKLTEAGLVISALTQREKLTEIV